MFQQSVLVCFYLDWIKVSRYTYRLQIRRLPILLQLTLQMGNGHVGHRCRLNTEPSDYSLM